MMVSYSFINKKSSYSPIKKNQIQLSSLKISHPNDPYELEAEKVSDQITQMSNPQKSDTLSRKCSSCNKKDEDELKISRKSASNEAGMQVSSDTATQIGSNTGHSLDGSTQEFMEPRFGYDFSNVKIHDDSQANELSESVNARAFTVGNEIFLGKSESTSDTKLMAHELTHVVQKHHNPDFTINRLGDKTRIPSGMSCNIANDSPTSVIGNLIFDQSSPSLTTLQKNIIENFVNNWWAAGENILVRVDGYASTEGSDELNWPLSCNRAQSVVWEMMHPSSGTKGIPSSFITTLAHGETDQFSQSLSPNRRVTISADLSQPSSDMIKRSTKKKKCTVCSGIPPTICGIYAANSWWLPIAYVQNATCACSHTPNHPKYNCIRKSLQDRLRAVSFSLRIVAARMKKYEIIAPLKYQKFVQTTLTPIIYADHVAAYRDACCCGSPASYLAWISVTSIPLPCAAVETAIKYTGTCGCTLGKWH